MDLDGQQHPFEVDESTGPGTGSCIAFNIPHFSTRVVTFEASRPDLTIRDVSSTPTDPIEGDAVSFFLEIVNEGDANASGFGVELTVGGDVLTTDGINLAANESTIFTLS